MPLTPNLVAFGFLSCLNLNLTIITNNNINPLTIIPVIRDQNKKFKNVSRKNIGATIRAATCKSANVNISDSPFML
ncbi:MAG: hypothetical protein WC422_04270 [Candidatus Paceibacterota bacterium]